MSVELVSAIGTAAAAILAGLATLLANGRRRAYEDSRQVRREAKQLQERHLAALRYIYQLEERLASRGLPAPKRPKILEWDDDESGAPANNGRLPRPPAHRITDRDPGSEAAPAR
jgi:hypothetical protein